MQGRALSPIQPGADARPPSCTQHLLSLGLWLFREQSHPFHSCMVRHINYVGHILKIHISISAHKGNSLCPFQIDFCQPPLQVFRTFSWLIFSIGG
jgi:hypothetical protein